MKTLAYATGVAAVCGALLALPLAAQQGPAETLHDGVWQVATEPATGPCSKRMEFKLSVDAGQISYAGMLPVEASGSVDPLGVIEIRVVRGAETVSAKGLVRGDTASGEWISPDRNCTGSWVARRA
ncbi:hypothetical protein [Ancylobacter amanitiformis]|uniref:Uncharacterized protein n=1 Tax=Ancylobacter amanitiformis TaxID=217069 RepID=A0ABU0LSD4_9HYPH|nr:hypothetical protein [Ancylobacter amanitiformis]MDQ0511613.1 hypothetical protein [Ancylobacter amanitiformis]